MSCPHTETTAILAVFGEAPPEFETHLEQCAECRSVLLKHESTLSLLEPIVAPRATPTDQVRWRTPSIALALAAAILLGFQFNQTQTTIDAAIVEPPTTTQLELTLFDDHIDEKIASLEIEIDLFHLEES